MNPEQNLYTLLMNKLVADGDKRYVNANAAALNEELRQRTDEIRSRYAALGKASLWIRLKRYFALQRDLERARREINGDANLYLTHLKR